MVWTKLDDARAVNKKLRKVGFAARGLDEAAMCWCSREESDGFIHEDDVEVLASLHAERQWKKLVKLLVDVGRWERDDEKGGWWIHDFLEYNPSHAELEEVRERDRKRKADNKAKRRAELDADVSDKRTGRPSRTDSAPDSDGVPAGIPAEANGSPPGGNPESAHPVPTRPDPSPEHLDDGSADVGADEARPRALRQPDRAWEALVAACLPEGASITRPWRGPANSALKAIRDAEPDLDPEQLARSISARAAAYRLKWPTTTLTPSALAKHWPELASAPLSAPRRPPSTPVGVEHDPALQAIARDQASQLRASLRGRRPVESEAAS